METIQGYLISQIGYDLNDPKRAIVRAGDPNQLSPEASFEVLDEGGRNVFSAPVQRWGEIWQSTWWVADFSALNQAGSFRLRVSDRGEERWRSEPFEIGAHLLWEKSIQAVAIDQFEERARQARNQKGWKDCGSEWREVNSHAAALIGLTDLLQDGYMHLSAAQVERLVGQIIQGCDYIAFCQDKAADLGYPDGAIVHEVPNHMIVLPADQNQSAVALTRAARLIGEFDRARSKEYLERAERVFHYCLHDLHPFGAEGFSPWVHGAPDDFQVPDEWMTRDLLMLVWAGMELFNAGKTTYREDAVRLARQVMQRQIPRAEAEGEFYGHFRTFASSRFSEKAFIHHHVAHDTGGSFPHYIVPLIDMCRWWYDHPDSPRWRETVLNFAYGYFLPACRKNPFFLLPVGYFSGEGLLNFCGPWHGFNTSIGFAAALAAELEGFTGDSAFRDIAVGNLQWIAGLHAGVTRDSLKGSQFWRVDIPAGQALPYSQIQGVGRQWVGNWSGIHGTIPNGFDVNPQFQIAVKPSRAADGPWLYTDEDWIPHAGGWISGLVHLRSIKRYRDA